MKTENGVTTYYIYGLGLIYETTDTDCKVYHYDYRGSTVALTDLTGDVTDTFTYDTYGKLLTRTGATATPFLYNGRDGVMSDENGLVYMRARYYSPTLKRFINADVIAGSIANAITLNRYAYANGNPVSNVDPLGYGVILMMIIGGALSATVEIVSAIIEQKITGNEIEADEMLIDIGLAFIDGAISASPLGVITSSAISVGITAVDSIIDEAMDETEGINWNNVLIDTGISAATEVIGYGISEIAYKNKVKNLNDQIDVSFAREGRRGNQDYVIKKKAYEEYYYNNQIELLELKGYLIDSSFDVFANVTRNIISDRVTSRK